MTVALRVAVTSIRRVKRPVENSAEELLKGRALRLREGSRFMLTRMTV